MVYKGTNVMVGWDISPLCCAFKNIVERTVYCMDNFFALQERNDLLYGEFLLKTFSYLLSTLKKFTNELKHEKFLSLIKL